MTINQLLALVLIAESGSVLAMMPDTKDLRESTSWLHSAGLIVSEAAPLRSDGPPRYKLTESGQALIDELLATPMPQQVRIWKVIR